MTETQEAIPGPESNAARVLRIKRIIDSGQHLYANDAHFLFNLWHELENAISWDTTCLNCAKLLDGCIHETQRAEAAEAEVERLRMAIEDRRAKVVIEHQCPECHTGIMHPAPELDMPGGQRVPKAPAWVCQVCKTVLFKDDASEGA